MSWHRCLDEYQDPGTFRGDLNACIQALRNVTFVLQKEMALTEGFKEWYESWQGAMKRSPLMKWSVQARNEIVKQGDLEKRSEVSARMIVSYLDMAAALRCGLSGEMPGVEIHASVLDAEKEILEKANAESLRRHAMGSAYVIVEREWIVESLPDHEVMNALAYVHSFLTTLVFDADCQFSAADAEDDLDPANVGDADSRYPDALLAPCMITTLDSRRASYRLESGAPVGGVVRIPQMSPELRARSMAAYGVPVLPPHARSALDFLWAYAEQGSRILRAGDEHGWFVLYFRGLNQIHAEVLQARDRADKFDLASQVALTAVRVGADGVVEVGESWLSPDAVDADGNFVEPAKHPERMEALVVSGVLASGEHRTVMVPFTRTFYGAVEVGEPQELEVKVSNFFAPLRAAWASTRRQR